MITRQTNRGCLGHRIQQNGIAIAIAFCLALFCYSEIILAENKPINVAVIRNWPPQYLTDSNTGKPGGFAIDMMNLIVARTGLAIEYKVFDTWQELNQAVRDGEVDLIANMGITENRLSDFMFTSPYDSFHVRFFIRTSTVDVSNATDLQTKIVGVVTDNVGKDLVKGLVVGSVQTFDAVEKALFALLAGTIDILVYPDTPLYRIAAQSGLEHRIKASGKPLIEIKRGVAVVAGKTELFIRVNEALSQILENSAYQEIYSKWYRAPEPYWHTRRVMLFMGIILGSTALVLVIWRFYSLWKVNRVLRQSMLAKEKAQQALQESETNFRQLAESIREVFWIVSPDWSKIEYISPAYEEIWGRTCQSLYQNPLSWMEAVVDEDRSEVDNYLAEKRQGAMTVIEFPEYRIRRPDGSLRWIYARGFPVRNKQGEIYRITGIAEDITASKLAAESLQASEEQVRLLLNHTGEAIYGIDPQGICTFANPACVSTLGYRSANDLIGRNMHQLIHHCFQDLTPYAEPDCKITHVMQTGESINEDNEVFWKADGTAIPVEYRSAPILKKGVITGAVVAFIDITRRKKDEAELKAAKAELEVRVERRTAELAILTRAVEQSPSVLVITDAEGVMEYVNPKFTALYGYTSAEVIGQKTSILQADNVTREDFKLLWETIKGGKEWQGELRNRKKNGERIWQLVSISPVKNQEGNLTHFIASQENIEAAKQIQFQLQKAKTEADRANQAKSALLANMSHELRTPLNAIIGFTQLLERKSFGEFNDKQLRFLDRIKEAGNHLLQMVNDILDLSKVEAGRFELDKKPFDCGMMLSRSPLTIQSLANKKNIRIVTKIPEDLGWLEGDEVRIKQVIFNLLSNAFKFTDSGKSIGIEAFAASDSITVVVWDEGIGISVKNQERIFKPFVQILNSNQPIEGGTGLGLAISKKLVELHGGTITVDSRPGEGSRFTITFPGRVAADQPLEKTPAVIQAIKAESNQPIRNILVTEDNEANRHLIEASLGRIGYELQFASSGEEAIQKATTDTYDLVLMDIQLPGITGVEAMKAIKRVRGNKFPIIAVTAFAMKGDRQKYLDDGFDAYVSKPIALDELQTAIETCLNNR